MSAQEVYDRLKPPPTNKPSKLRELREEVLAALSETVKSSASMGPTERAQVLREVALAHAALDEAQVRNRIAWTQWQESMKP